MSAATWRRLVIWAAILLAWAVWLAAVVYLALAVIPKAHADPGCFDAGSADCGGHHWNGPLRQTWDTPGYYGGQTGDNQLLCSPFTYDCQGVTSAP